MVFCTLTRRHIIFHTFYTLAIEYKIILTSDLLSHHLFLNERLNIIEYKDGSVAASIIPHNGFN